MKYYKIMREDDRHYGMQYHDGLNVDVLPFNPSGDCKKGGIYFSREDILAFLGYGTHIREVTLPEDAQVYENPGAPKKWKADKVILSPRREITADIIRELIAEGADVHADNDYALRWAARNGHTETAKLLLDAGADVHAEDDAALYWAAARGHSETVKLLLDHGADVHTKNNDALRWAAAKGHAETVQLLLDAGADVHADNDYALRWATRNGRTETVKLLLDAGADVHAENDYALRWTAEYGHMEVVKLLQAYA